MQIRLGLPNGPPILDLSQLGAPLPIGNRASGLAIDARVVPPQVAAALQQGLNLFLSWETNSVNFTGPLQRLVCAMPANPHLARITQLGPVTPMGPNRYRAMFEVVNVSSQDLNGPAYLVFSQLTAGVLLANAAGQTMAECLPGEYSYLELPVGRTWERGERVMVMAEFESPAPNIGFTAQVFYGGDQL